MESDSDSVNLEESGEVMAPPPSLSPGLQVPMEIPQLV